MRVVVTGATGFVGRHLVSRLLRDGHSVTALTHRRLLQNVFDPRVTMVPGSIDDSDGLAAAFANADAVWHLVGIIAETGKASFEGTVAQGTRNVVEACCRAEVRWLGYLSAMGTSSNAPSRYHQAKFAAEQTVAASGLEFVILRPSVIYGPGDGFVSMLVSLIRRTPIVPVIGDGKYLLQPVFIEDVAAMASQALASKAACGQRIDVGGPEKLEYLDILDIIIRVLGLNRKVVHIPVSLVKPLVAIMEKLSLPAPLTSDQLIMMQMGSTGDISRTREIFEFSPTDLATGLRKYLR